MHPGEKIGPFEIEKEIGAGAMGSVYRARYEKTGQRVAIKVITPGLAGSENAMARFEREMDVLKQLKHPNIVRLLATGHYHKAPFYAMEYVEGESLDKALARKGRFTWEEVVELGKQLCAALKHAHDAGIVHRDLKPSNVMVTKDGTLKLTDFGIAKDLDVSGLTSAHCTVGTASYMSPEQCRGEKTLSHKSDLYSLGIMLYELLTGKKPFEAEAVMDMFMLHAEGKFERPARRVLDIPVWLDTLICQLLEKKPEKRPFDATIVGETLERVVEKVTAQESAGVNASRRLVSARHSASGPDESRGKKGRRRRKSEEPFYTSGWFVGLLVIAFLGSMAWLIVLAFRPASPDKLYLEAKALMAANDGEKRNQARDGPIKEFLTRYPERSDSQAQQMRDWADEIDLALLERRLANRHRFSVGADSEPEKALAAIDQLEKTGDLAKAAERLTEMREKYKDNPEERAWSLLATTRLSELQNIQKREQELAAQVREAWDKARNPSAADPAQPRALDAMRFEALGDLVSAAEVWQKLRDKSAGNPTNRAAYLMAAGRSRSLNEQLSPDAVKRKELQRQALGKQVQDALEYAKKKDLPAARFLMREIADLYRGNPAMEDMVAKVKGLVPDSN